MKARYIAISAIILSGIIATEYCIYLAYQERGYFAIGGEFAPVVFAVAFSAVILQVCERRNERV
ncbi:MAG TPA: hypothetical protein DEQ02_08095 [Ruminococcaceae bacterium]|nr:hypothetical protein [Oscillospiraceae bacterium]